MPWNQGAAHGAKQQALSDEREAWAKEKAKMEAEKAKVDRRLEVFREAATKGEAFEEPEEEDDDMFHDSLRL
jgi:hypothetical protein